MIALKEGNKGLLDNKRYFLRSSDGKTDFCCALLLEKMSLMWIAVLYITIVGNTCDFCLKQEIHTGIWKRRILVGND